MLQSSTARDAFFRRLAAFGSLALAAGAAMGQTGLAPASPSAPAPAASAADVPGRLKPVPKPSAPSDAQRSLNLNNAQPEGRVTPQIRIPLGKKPDAPILQRRPTETSTSSTAPNGSVDDAVARCEAERSVQVRVRCREQLARQGTR